MVIDEEETLTRVLLTENDDDDYLIFTLAIKETNLGVTLTRAETGDELFTLLNKNIPDILFLDIQIPCRDGRQCLREIRSQSRYDNLPVILYTSLNDAQTIEYTFREGGNLYVIKPSSITQLTEVLKRILTINWKTTLYFPAKSDFVLNPL